MHSKITSTLAATGFMTLTAVATAAPVSWATEGGRFWFREDTFSYYHNSETFTHSFPRITNAADGPIVETFSQSYGGTRTGMTTMDINTSIYMRVVGDAVVYGMVSTLDLEFTSEFTDGFTFSMYHSGVHPLVDVIQGSTVNVNIDTFAFAPNAVVDQLSNSNGYYGPQVGVKIDRNEYVGVVNGLVGSMASSSDPEGIPVTHPYLPIFATDIDLPLTFAGTRLATDIEFANMLVSFDTDNGHNPLDYNGRYGFGFEIIVGTIPAPSTAGLLGLAGVMASRRRRA